MEISLKVADGRRIKQTRGGVAAAVVTYSGTCWTAGGRVISARSNNKVPHTADNSGMADNGDT
jgi:hypothetical protein